MKLLRNTTVAGVLVGIEKVKFKNKTKWFENSVHHYK